MYHLASVRLRDLCLKLDVSNDLRRKIWTCFEFTLVHCKDLMKDRHLDQLLLCAFYIMAKVRHIIVIDTINVYFIRKDVISFPAVRIPQQPLRCTLVLELWTAQD